MPSPAQSGFRTNWNRRPSLRAGVSVMTFRLGTGAEIEEIFPVISSSFPCYEPTLNCSIGCNHVWPSTPIGKRKLKLHTLKLHITLVTGLG